jgi:hypothetical protein
MGEISKLDWLAAFIKQVMAMKCTTQETAAMLLTQTGASKYNFRCTAIATMFVGTKLGLSH